MDPELLKQYSLIILIAGVAIVFVADLIGNILTFRNPRLNATVTAIVSLLLFFGALEGLMYVQFGGFPNMPPNHFEFALALSALGVQSVFVADVIGNSILFDNRVGNALVTAVVWGLVFVGTTVALERAFGLNILF